MNFLLIGTISKSAPYIANTLCHHSLLVFFVSISINIIFMVLLVHLPEISALYTDVDQVEMIFGDVIERHNLIAIAFLSPALINLPFRKRRVIHNIGINDQPLRLGLQISLVHTVLVLRRIFTDLLGEAAHFALVDELCGLLNPINPLLGIQQIIAILAETLSLEFVGVVHFF